MTATADMGKRFDRRPPHRPAFTSAGQNVSDQATASDTHG
jgi:hypothetical protein